MQKQEHLYAFYETTERSYWTELARYIKYLTDIDEWQRMDKNQKIEKETLASRLSRLQKQNEKIQPDIQKAAKNREPR